MSRPLPKKMLPKKILFGVLIVLLSISALYGLFVVGQFIGYASHSGSAGNIYTMVIQHEIPVDEWAGIFGVALRFEDYFNQQSQTLDGGDLEEENLLFDCISIAEGSEVYMSLADPSSIDLSFVTPANPSDIDTYYGNNPSDLTSATNTFTESITWELGTQTITAPGTYTYKLDELGQPRTFATAIVEDNAGNFVFVSLTTNLTTGFSGRLHNYQGILPIRANTTERYYFYVDPNDECPQGEGLEPLRGFVIGNVSDTTGIRLEDVIVDVAGYVDLSDVTGYYNVSPREGTYNIFAIKEGYKVYHNNVTVEAGNITVHDIILEVEEIPNPNTGIGTGIDDPGDQTQTGESNGQDVGPGQSNGEGPGEIPPIPYVEQPQKIEGVDYVISLNDLRRKIRPGNFLQESIYVFSFKKSPITVTFEITGNATDLIEFDTNQLVLDPDSNGNVILTIFGRGPTGVYNGTLEIGGDINASVPVEIEILDKDRLPVEALDIELELSDRGVLPDEVFKFKTDLRNRLIDQPYAVRLFYTIQPADGGETVWSDEGNVYLRTAFSIIKSAKMPRRLPPGEYILRVSAHYLGISSGTSTIFTVEVPFWQRQLFGLRYWHWSLIILAILLLGLAGFLIKRNIDAKKKYHLKVEMSELPAPGPRNIFVGKIAETDHKTYFNLEKFKVHTIVAGSTGGGKSVSAQVIIEEALDKNIAVVVFDPTAQWTGMLRPCKDKTMLALYPYFGMKKTDAKAFSGNVRMILDAREQIDIKKYIKPGEIQVFCFHKLDPKDMDIVVANAIRSVFRSGPDESKPLKVMFVFDEVHRLLPKFGGSGDGFLQIERACREFRKWGLGVMLISQVLSDFVGTIKANINTEIQMRTRDEGDLERIRQKYGEDVLRSLVKATVGSGMVENPAYNRGRPYFVAFKPLKHSVERMTDDEIQKYNDYNDKVDDLLYSLDQLEEEGVDIFDLQLELKLALDKVKSGNFNMVDVYLEGLVPRISKHWEKLGKTPKKFERELIDLADLKEELTKAKQERDKYVAEQEAKKGAPEEEKKEIGWKDDVAPDKMLNLVNGMIVINLASLYDEVAAMKDEDFEKHIDDKHNDLAKWVMDAIGDTKLAYNLYATTDKAKMLEILEKKKNEEELPDVKPPAYLAGAVKETKAAPTGAEGETAEGKPATELPAGQTKPDVPAETSSFTPPPTPSAESQPVETPPATPPTAPPAESPLVESPPADQSPPDEHAQPKVESSSEAAIEALSSDEPDMSALLESELMAAAEEAEELLAQEEEQAEAELAKQLDEVTGEPSGQPASEPTSSTPEQAQQGGASVAQSEPKRPSGRNLDVLVTEDPGKYFKLENGMQLRGLSDLRSYLSEMDEGIFKAHVSSDYNHFADWISGVFHEDSLAGKLRGVHSKDEMKHVLDEYARGAA